MLANCDSIKCTAAIEIRPILFGFYKFIRLINKAKWKFGFHLILAKSSIFYIFVTLLLCAHTLLQQILIYSFKQLSTFIVVIVHFIFVHSYICLIFPLDIPEETEQKSNWYINMRKLLPSTIFPPRGVFPLCQMLNIYLSNKWLISVNVLRLL